MTLRQLAGALLVTVVLILSGCTSAPPAARQPTPEPSPPPAIDPTEDAAGEGEDPHGNLSCDEATVAAVDQTIAGQLDAFAAGDFETALSLASAPYQAGTDTDQFQDLIVREYPFLLDDASHVSTYCVASDGQAQVLVTIQPRQLEAQELVYRMVQEGGQWRVDSAGIADPSGGQPPLEV